MFTLRLTIQCAGADGPFRGQWFVNFPAARHGTTALASRATTPPPAGHEQSTGLAAGVSRTTIPNAARQREAPAHRGVLCSAFAAQAAGVVGGLVFCVWHGGVSSSINRAFSSVGHYRRRPQHAA